MKRSLLIIGSMFAVGSLLTSCGTTEGRLTAAEQRLASETEYINEIKNTEGASKVLSQKEELERENEKREKEKAERLASRTVFKTDYGTEYYAIEDYYLQLPEYRNVKEFTNYRPTYWEEQKASFPDDKYQNSMSEAHAANATVTYINWFKEVIEELGLNEVFNKWQLVSYEFMKIEGAPSFERHDELVVEYEEAMLKAVEAINNLVEKGK